MLKEINLNDLEKCKYIEIRHNKALLKIDCNLISELNSLILIHDEKLEDCNFQKLKIVNELKLVNNYNLLSFEGFKNLKRVKELSLKYPSHISKLIEPEINQFRNQINQ